MIQITDKPEQNPGESVCYPIIRGLAFAVTSDGNVDELGDSDDWNLGVQDDAENIIIICSIEKMTKLYKNGDYLLWGHVDFWSFEANFLCHFEFWRI